MGAGEEETKSRAANAAITLERGTGASGWTEEGEVDEFAPVLPPRGTNSGAPEFVRKGRERRRSGEADTFFDEEGEGAEAAGSPETFFGEEKTRPRPPSDTCNNQKS